MIGSTISHYRIIEQLGQGGMGVVYKAEDTRLHRPVALKFLPPQLSGDEEAKQRFMQEARAASALDHANICSIYDIGEAEVEGAEAKRLFIVMAFYDGETLKYRLKDGPLPIESYRSIGAQLAAGLERAHEAGIVHRDMKPANVMVTDRGEVKILDFGVAKLAGGLELTRTGSTLGTAAYMSPEQARGELVDYRSDLWSVGVILYEMLTGSRPFTGDYEAAIAYAILNEPHAPVESLRPDVPVEIARAVDRLLRKDPRERFQSAGELKAALGGVQDTSTVTAAPIIPPKPPAAKVANRRLHWVVGSVAILLALVAVIVLWPGQREDAAPAATATQQPEGPHAIAVLPFTDVSPNRDSEYMSDGLTEELIYALSRLQNLSVAGRTSSFYFKGRNENIKSIAQQLDVNLVLNGSVRRDGDALRVTAELVNASDGFQLWSERYDRQVDDVFAVQEDITRSIVEALQIRLTGTESTRLNQRGTENLEAYTRYLRGRQQWNLRTRDGLANAVELFEQAIARDPSYARAHAGLADAYLILADWGFMAGPVARGKAEAAARQALDLNPDLPEGYIALAAIEGWYDRNFAAAIPLFEKALQLDPRYATGHQWHGEVLTGVGRCTEGAAHMDRAVELDPLSPIINSTRVLPYLCLKEYDEVLRLTEATLDLFPDFQLTRVFRALAYLGKGDRDRAEETVEDCSAPDCIGILGMILGLKGDREGALALLRSPNVANSGNLRPVLESWIHIGAGNVDSAFDGLYEAIPQGNSYLLFVNQWSIYDPIRNDPRFDRLVRDLGLNGTP